MTSVAVLVQEASTLWLREHARLCTAAVSERVRLLAQQARSAYATVSLLRISQEERAHRQNGVAAAEQQERCVIVQWLRSELATLRQRERDQVAVLNTKGSELQVGLAGKRDELLRQQESLRAMRQDVADETARVTASAALTANVQPRPSVSGSVESCELLAALQDEFVALHEELDSRPTAEDAGIASLREQVMSLSVELNEKRELLARLEQQNSPNERAKQHADAGARQKRATFAALLEQRRGKKAEMQASISQLREELAKNEEVLSILNINEERAALALRESELRNEIAMLRAQLDGGSSPTTKLSDESSSDVDF